MRKRALFYLVTTFGLRTVVAKVGFWYSSSIVLGGGEGTNNTSLEGEEEQYFDILPVLYLGYNQ